MKIGLPGYISVAVDFIHHLVFEWNMLFRKVSSFPLSCEENGQEPSVWNARQCLKSKINVIYQHQNPLESVFSHMSFLVPRKLSLTQTGVMVCV
jgi:hypothetical protein